MEKKNLLALNTDFLEWYYKKNIDKSYNLSELQKFVNIIITWYEIKYPKAIIENNENNNILTINMTIDELKKRLPDNLSKLLDYDEEKNCLSEIATKTLSVVPCGLINSLSLTKKERITGFNRALKFYEEFSYEYGHLFRFDGDDLKEVPFENELELRLAATKMFALEFNSIDKGRKYNKDLEQKSKRKKKRS